LSRHSSSVFSYICRHRRFSVTPFPFRGKKEIIQGIDHYTFLLNWPYLAVLAALALALGILYSANLNNDWLLRALRKLRITQRTARSSTWNDAFQDIQSTYVLVEISGGRSIIGYVRYYSDEAKDSSLFLEDAAWIVDETGTQEPIDGPGILLTKQSGIESVSFLNSAQRDPREES
jgi:hypothetical protein